ncbi:TPA: hypothetical protein RSW56_003627, partial [Vibrio cholerae]|nr:hypothetical protein [Vibrio cholerae]
EVEYELQGGENEADKNRFFHIKLTSKDDSKIDEFQDLLKATRTLLHMAFDKRPQILWDDISFYYSEKAYPIIHEIENLMRKLITKFMLTNVGLGWTRDTVPEELKKSTRTEPANNNNYLYETDFKDLSTFLFDEYRTLDIKALNEKIRLLEEQGGDVSLSEFKGFLPKSNWERYFREHVNCDSSYLQVRWDRLYKLRCKIAHNNFFSKDDFEQVMILVQDVKPKIEDAIKNLDKVEVPEDEREELAEVVASKTSTLYGEYIQKWKHIEKAIIAIVKEVSPTEDIPKHRPLMVHLKELINIGLFDKSLYDELKEANHIRNIIVHESERHLSNDELLYRINNLNIIADYISRFGVLVENDS